MTFHVALAGYSLHTSLCIVIPAQAGIQGRSFQAPTFEEAPLDSRLRGNDEVRCLALRAYSDRVREEN
jgi:hypothetical protein